MFLLSLEEFRRILEQDNTLYNTNSLCKNEEKKIINDRVRNVCSSINYMWFLTLSKCYFGSFKINVIKNHYKNTWSTFYI